VISWLDQRGRKDDDALTKQLGRDWFLRRLGHGRSGLAIGQLLRTRRETPARLNPPNRVGFVGDVIVGRLCGRAAHDGTSCGLTLLYNPGSRSYDADVLARLGISEQQLPDLISPRVAAGLLLPEMAEQTGLPAGIPVSPAIHDQYTAAFGTGTTQAGTVMVGAGTAWVLLAVSDRWADPVIDDAFVCTHVVDGLFGQIVSLVNGGSAITWGLRLLNLGDVSGEALDQLLATVPPGADGLSFWPFLTPFGASGLIPGTRGRLSGLQLSHQAAHVVRAVVEGLVFELRRHLEFLRSAGWPVETLVTGGTAAASQVTPQIIADVTGMPLLALSGGEGSLLGAAIVARGLLEPTRSLAELATEMRPSGRSIQPGSDSVFYGQRYQEYLSNLPLPRTPSL
jgi:sugar (pentulose or hexulose) kinase